MGIYVPCALLILTVLCSAIPGAAADPFDMPASFAFEHLANGEPPFTAAYGHIMDMAYDYSQSSSNGLPGGLPGLSGTVRPTDTLFQPQFLHQDPNAFPTPPSSSGPSYYVPPQPRHDTYSAMELDSTADIDQTYEAQRHVIAPRLEQHVPYTQAEYHADDRLAGGRTEGSNNAALEIHSTSRRRPHILRGYPCTVCGSSFNRQRDLNLHARTHNPQQECPECDRRFVSRREVNRHVESVHRRSRSYQCNICLSAFSRKDNLDRHVSTVHHGRRRPVVVHNQIGH